MTHLTFPGTQRNTHFETILEMWLETMVIQHLSVFWVMFGN